MENQKETCTSCKIISVCCFCGIGTYLIYTGRTYHGTSKLLINILGLGSLGLGIGEIFNMSPIRKERRNT